MIDLKAVIDNGSTHKKRELDPPGRKTDGGRKQTSTSQAVPINPSKQAWSARVICFLSVDRQQEAPGCWCSPDRQLSYSIWSETASLYRADTRVWQVLGRSEAIYGLWNMEWNEPFKHYKPDLRDRGTKERHHHYCLLTLSSPHSPPCGIHTYAFRKDEERDLAYQHTVSLIKSQIHSTVFKIQMFFTDTSRKKGAEQNDPTKVIRIHLQGLIPHYSQLIIRALCSWRTPRDHIINVLHIHYATNGNSITKQPWHSGRDKISVPSSSTFKSIQDFSKNAVEPEGKLQVGSFHIKQIPNN